MQALKDFLTSYYGLMSVAVIIFTLVMVVYIGRFLYRPVQ